MSSLGQLMILLAATVIAVPLFKRLGLGTVLGYLAAGALLGQHGFALLEDLEQVGHIAELGVVLLLFLIGLELAPSRLWDLRRTVFGLGTAQVLGSTVLVGGLLLLVLPWQGAFVAGFGLALSSTAFALAHLAEKNELAQPQGRIAFGILLFQDIAVIPLLAALPALGVAPAPSAEAAPLWSSALKIIGVLLALALSNRVILRPLFRLVARARSQEVFTASALLVALGTALVVSKVGLSMSLGAFLAGVLLADCEYRHELEADIEPFKGLLLGLFFMTVGMSMNLQLVVTRPLLVLGAVLGLTALKMLVLFAIGRGKLKNTEQSLSLAIAISQGGEFAFVLFSVAREHKIFDAGAADLLVATVGLSMLVTPLSYMLFDKQIRPRLRAQPRRDFDVSPDEDAPVIIAGFGRVGQVIGRVLFARHIKFTALDASAEHIDFVKRFGNLVFYGDAARVDLLRAARADQARILVLAIDDIEASVRTVQSVKAHFPHLTIFARARNRQHVYRLMALGVEHIMRETFAGSLELTAEILGALGYDFAETKATIDRFRDHDEALLRDAVEFAGDEAKLAELAKKSRAELESLFDKDRAGQ